MMAFETKTPGIRCHHVFSTPECRLRNGAELDDAREQLRAKYNEVKDAPANEKATFHFVLTVEWPVEEKEPKP